MILMRLTLTLERVLSIRGSRWNRCSVTGRVAE